MKHSHATPLADKPVLRMLYVDDEPSLVGLAKRKLVELGYAVTGFTDSRQAWSKFQEHPGDFDVVVSDLNMPGTTGEDLALQMRGLRPDLPIILVSGDERDDDEIPESLGGDGNVANLNKPFRMEDLDQRVRGLMRKDA